MSATIKRTVEMAKGYNGKTSAFHKGWIARLTPSGREFQKGKPTTDDPYRKSKCCWKDEYILNHGIYEKSEGGERSLFIVWFKESEGKTTWTNIDYTRADKIVEAIKNGLTFEEARVATKP